MWRARSKNMGLWVRRPDEAIAPQELERIPALQAKASALGEAAQKAAGRFRIPEPAACQQGAGADAVAAGQRGPAGLDRRRGGENLVPPAHLGRGAGAGDPAFDRVRLL